MEIDGQMLFNGLVGLVLVIIGWWARTVWDSVQTLTKSLAEFREEVASERVHREEFQRVVDAIFAKLDKILDKIDRKADKP